MLSTRSSGPAWRASRRWDPGDDEDTPVLVFADMLVAFKARSKFLAEQVARERRLRACPS